MISKSTFEHLRIGFSFFLLPVFLFAISQAPQVDPTKLVLAFICWHFFIYPASNAYNSYFDRDEGSIALIKNPLPVGKELYNVALILDCIGIIVACFIGFFFAFAVLLYGIISKMYSHPSIRLKKYPWL